MFKDVLPDSLKVLTREKFFIGFLALLVLALFLFPILRAQNNPSQEGYRVESVIPYSNLRNRDLNELISIYHETMNEKVNERITWLTEATEEEFPERERLPVRDDNNELTACPEKATSTFCVARFLVDEFSAFREELLSRRGRAVDEARKFAGSEDATHENLEDLINKSGNILGKIDREILVSEKAVDMTLAAYQELHMAWPLHKKYEAVIEALSQYRDKLANMRDSLELFPNRFRNVSTTQCT